MGKFIAVHLLGFPLLAQIFGLQEDAEHPQPAVGAWAAYAEGKPFIAPSPAEEAAARIVRNRTLAKGCGGKLCMEIISHGSVQNLRISSLQLR